MSDAKKKPSGSQFKKRRLNKQTQLQKQSGALQNFLKEGSLNAPTTDQHLNNAQHMHLDTDFPDMNPPLDANVSIAELVNSPQTSLLSSDAVPCSSKNKKLQVVQTSEKHLEETTVPIISSDPGLWPEIMREADRVFLVKRGPAAPLYNFDFPYDDQHRRFSPKYYKKALKNGEQVLREWMVYSLFQNVLYCFPCRLFAAPSSTSALGHRGFKDWKHLGDSLAHHENGKTHIDCLKSWLELKQRLKMGKTIDAVSQRLIDSEINHWSEVLLRIISVVRMLGERSLAFRGTTDKLYEHNNGNFLKFIQLLAEFDPKMEEHVRRVLNKEEIKATYLGKTIQNEIIDLLHDNIKRHIIEQVQKAKYYSVILDCTPDASKVEQMTFMARYVSIEESESEVQVIINENFLGFLPIERSKAAELSEVLVEELEKNELKVENMRGQGYDNGSNMRGEKSGVQTRIRNINPRAFYVPCSSHSLNLVVNDMAKSSFEAANFFNIVQKLYTFFASSTFRWAILLKYIDSYTLKPLSDTRWESRVDSLKALRFQIGPIYDALYSIYEDPEIDNMIRDEASGLLNNLKQFKFICSIVIWYKILSRINPISKLLQTVHFDISQAIDTLNNCKLFFENLRSDEAFESIILEATELASEVDVEANFEATTPRHRIRNKTRNVLYEGPDEPVQDLKQKYKIELFFHTVDQAINALETRYNLLNTHSNYFSFLYNIFGLKDMRRNELLAYCKDLEVVLTDGNSSDLNALELADEISIVSSLLTKKETPVEVLKFIATLKLAPNLSIALRILLTLPVTVASGERSFSKLKIIKNYLRTMQTQNRLNGLAMIAIEHQISDKLDLKSLVREFAERKVRKKAF